MGALPIHTPFTSENDVGILQQSVKSRRIQQQVNPRAQLPLE